MKVRFIEQGHVYESKPALSWTSVTKLVETYQQPFDAQEQAYLSSQNVRSKWYGIHPDTLLDIWESENKRATDTGTWLHILMENKALQAGKKIHRGKELVIKPPNIINNYKLAPDQRLSDGIYPEHLIYNEKYKVAGQSDLVYVTGPVVDIGDYKTNKEIERTAFRHQCMLSPLDHLEDCNYNHYALQLSLYMKLILLKNPQLKPGKLTLYHAIFEKEGSDKFGFPILKKNGENFIVEKFVKYNLPYLEKEVSLILKNIAG